MFCALRLPHKAHMNILVCHVVAVTTGFAFPTSRRHSRKDPCLAAIMDARPSPTSPGSGFKALSAEEKRQFRSMIDEISLRCQKH